MHCVYALMYVSVPVFVNTCIVHYAILPFFPRPSPSLDGSRGEILRTQKSRYPLLGVQSCCGCSFFLFFFLPVGKNVALCASSVARNSSLLVSVFPIHSASWFFQIPFNYTACFPCGPTARSESPCSWSRFVKSDIASIISLRLIFFFSF